MQKKLCKVVYDTENATVVKKFTYGNFGESNGYEETLYQTPNGLYFVYVNGVRTRPIPRRILCVFPRKRLRLGLKSITKQKG